MNLPVDEDFGEHLAGISGDMAEAFEYSLEGAAKKWWDKLVEAARSGNYHRDYGQRWDLRTIREQARETVSEAWHDTAWKEWQKLQKNPKEMARLDSMRPNSSW